MEKAKSFLKLILVHIEQKKTGLIRIEKDQLEKTIYLKSGKIIFIDSSLRSENLGRILVDKGKLSEEKFQEVVERVAQSGKRQGEVLVEMGILTPYEVYEALQDQLAKKLLNCFVLYDFDYEFVGGANHLEGVTEIPINDLRIIIDGVQTSYNYDVLREEGGFSKEIVPVVNKAKTSMLNEIKLKPEEVKLLRMFNGTHTLLEITRSSGYDPQFVLSTVFVLNTLGLIDYIAAPDKKERAKQIITEKISGRASDSSDDDGFEEKEIPQKDEKHIEVREDAKKQKEEPPKKEKESKGSSPKDVTKPPKRDSPIYELFIKIDTTGYLELFRLSVKFKKEDLRKNYEKLISDYKLDRIDSEYGDQDREAAEKVLNKIVTAFTVLHNEKKKDEYLKMRAKIEKPKDFEGDNLLKAEIEMNKAQMFRKKADMKRAIDHVKKAIDFNEKEIEYYIALADFLMSASGGQAEHIPDEVEEILKRARSIDQNNFTVYLYLGTYYKITGDRDKAINCFSRVLDLNPGNKRASAELRLFNMRGDKKPFFSLFSKKPKKQKKQKEEKDSKKDAKREDKKKDKGGKPEKS